MKDAIRKRVVTAVEKAVEYLNSETESISITEIEIKESPNAIYYVYGRLNEDSKRFLIPLAAKNEHNWKIELVNIFQNRRKIN